MDEVGQFLLDDADLGLHRGTSDRRVLHGNATLGRLDLRRPKFYCDNEYCRK